MSKSLFRELHEIPTSLVDRALIDTEKSIDVIIPLINTNELWERNLFNFYNEIPIRNLIIGDGGCTDPSIEIVSKFPRVKILDHKALVSQGGSIVECIKEVTTDFFVYLHADVFLPEGWFDEMWRHRNEYDWYECNRHTTVLLHYVENRQNEALRPLSGSQMGRRKAFDSFLETIQDDYLQRNEDIILADLVKQNGGTYCRVPTTFHYHQTTNKRGELEPKIDSVSVVRQTNPDWEKRVYQMHIRGLVKYIDPVEKYHYWHFDHAIHVLKKYGAYDRKEFMAFVKQHNRAWLRVLRTSALRNFVRGARKLLGYVNAIVIKREVF